jgi:hypothetical protein
MSSEFLASGQPRGSAESASPPDAAEGYGKPSSGGPASKRSARKRPGSWRARVMAGVAVVAMAGGSGVALVAGSSGTPANAATAAAVRVQAPSPSDPGWGHVPILHGQAVLTKPGGGYQTIDFQRGAVTAVSSGSITVKSTDGYTKSYAITGSTVVGAHRGGISSVAAGNEVSVVGTVSGKTVTAARIIDWTLLQKSHMQFGFGHGG